MRSPTDVLRSVFGAAIRYSVPLTAALLLPCGAIGADATSAHYRLVAPGTASAAATAASPLYSLYVVGGSGQAVGISASSNNSMVIGGTSNQLPTDRLFRDSLEG